MPFSGKVAETALVACGRHCCLCHKFCGVKIELHHVIPESEGGDDTLENCIPLCFDCHTEVMHYNEKHPRGRKFTMAELKQHRDSWYRKASLSGVVYSDPAHREMDRKLLIHVRELLRDAIDYVRHRNYAGFSFNVDRHDPFFAIASKAQEPEFEFMDADLEASKAQLMSAVQEFNKAIALNTFPTNRSDRNAVPDEWEYEQPQRFRKAVSEIHTPLEATLKAYDELIRLGRRKLAID